MVWTSSTNTASEGGSPRTRTSMRPGARRAARDDPAWRVGAPPRTRQGATGRPVRAPIAAARQSAWSKPRSAPAQRMGGDRHERGRRREQSRRGAGDDLRRHRVGHGERAAELERVHERARRALEGDRRPRPRQRRARRRAAPPARRRQAAARAARPAQEAQLRPAGPAQRLARRHRRAAVPARGRGEHGQQPRRSSGERRSGSRRAAVSTRRCWRARASRLHRAIATILRSGCGRFVDVRPGCPGAHRPGRGGLRPALAARARQARPARRARLAPARLRRAACSPLIAALISPIDRLGEQAFAMHMVQHILLLDVVPILLIVGLTKVILRPATRRLQRLERAAGPLAHPAAAVVLYVARHVGLARPRALRRRAAHPPVHALEHTFFMTAGVLYWWHLHVADPLAHAADRHGPRRLHALDQAARRDPRHRDHLRPRGALRLLQGPAADLGPRAPATTRRWPARSWPSSSRSSWASRSPGSSSARSRSPSRDEQRAERYADAHAEKRPGAMPKAGDRGVVGQSSRSRGRRTTAISQSISSSAPSSMRAGPSTVTAPRTTTPRPKVTSPDDRQPLALHERRRPGREARLEVADELVVVGVEVDDRRLLARGRELDAMVVAQHVGVRAQREQVVGRLDRREAPPRDVQGARALEHADRGAHRRLELHDRRASRSPTGRPSCG